MNTITTIPEEEEAAEDSGDTDNDKRPNKQLNLDEDMGKYHITPLTLCVPKWIVQFSPTLGCKHSICIKFVQWADVVEMFTGLCVADVTHNFKKTKFKSCCLKTCVIC